MREKKIINGIVSINKWNHYSRCGSVKTAWDEMVSKAAVAEMEVMGLGRGVRWVGLTQSIWANRELGNAHPGAGAGSWGPFLLAQMLH